jgi:hypothetical protein
LSIQTKEAQVKKQASAGLVLLAFAGLAGEAAAQDTARTTATPWYFGLGLGRTFAKIPQQSIDNLTSSVATLFGGTSLSADTETSHATEGRIFLG